MTNEAIILAGGYRNKLTSDEEYIPQSMVLINGRPLLEYQLNYLEHWGISHVILAVGYKADLIKNYFKDEYKSIQLEYVECDKSLGSGGAIKEAIQKVNASAIFVLNGETFFDVSLRRLFNFKRSKEADIVIAIRFVPEEAQCGSVKINSDARITNFNEKADQYGEEYIYGGISCIGTRYFLNKNTPNGFSMGTDFIEKYYESDAMYGFKCYSYFIDIRTTKNLKKAQNEFRSLPY
jgi:D-glycero-alpha-D-manno-heptose 1-phosphate guanylyltransferase